MNNSRAAEGAYRSRKKSPRELALGFDLVKLGIAAYARDFLVHLGVQPAGAGQFVVSCITYPRM
jgi:hypothetical protein